MSDPESTNSVRSVAEYVAAIVAAAPEPTAEQLLIVKRSGLFAQVKR